MAADLAAKDDNVSTVSDDTRLRIGHNPRKALVLLSDKGGTVTYASILKIFGGNSRDARYSIRNLLKRGFLTRDIENDTTSITTAGSAFLKKYRGK